MFHNFAACNYDQLLNFVGASTGNNSSNRLTISIIAGAVGGAALFFIVLLCIVILYVRQSHKRSHDDDYKKAPEMNSSINININPSYNITEVSKQAGKSYDDEYDYVINERYDGNKQETMTMEPNPSYGRVRGCNSDGYDTTTVPHPNASSRNTSTTRIPEDEYYVDYHSYGGTTTDGGVTKVNYNPSYDVSCDGVEMENNPCYIQLNKHS